MHVVETVPVSCTLCFWSLSFLFRILYQLLML